MRRKKPVLKNNTISAVPFCECPAKTYSIDGSNRQGRDVFDHCYIVGLIARKLIHGIPPAIRDAIFPEGSELIAASHDIGKASPTFVLKILQALGREWKDNYPEHPCPHEVSNLDESHWGGHAGVTALTLKEAGYSEYIYTIAGQHHGGMPPIGMRSATASEFGGATWHRERVRLIESLKQKLNTDFPKEELSDPQVLTLSGLTSVADWIGSGPLFDDPGIDGQQHINAALQKAGYVPFKLHAGLKFDDIFPFKPRQAQQALIDVCKAPGVYIMEAPMGLGKTEAALYAAYQILEQQQATGIYFALPTKMTSNKIYKRFNSFLKKILAEKCEHRQALLLHSHAWLVETEIGKKGAPGKSWFDSAKRGLLAPFAVGTLDQALMAAMRVRHGFVRTFGLTGKVVILDEVHSYDAYTGFILNKLIDILRQLHCTVIILSATLNKTQREQLLNLNKAALSNNRPLSEEYPLITANPINTDAPIKETYVHWPSTTSVRTCLIENDRLAIEEALRRAENKQQVLWIENTVKDAQDRYYDFAARCQELGIACGLLHSRFTYKDRIENEDKWVDVLGKEGRQERLNHGRIVVGTQVLEQSLDIDADFLVSRFAPTDMLLQRLGRLWRHRGTPRVQGASCEAWIMAPALEDAIESPEKYFGGSSFVYSYYVLCRSLDVWTKHLAKQEENIVRLPDDIRCLIENTYSERNETGAMSQHKQVLFDGKRGKKGLNALRQQARVAIAKAGQVLADTEAQTRYSEEDSGQILLLKSITVDSDQEATNMCLPSGDTVTLPWKRDRLKPQEWREISRRLMEQMVPCRQSLLPDTDKNQRFWEVGFGHALYIGKKNETLPFAVAIVDNGKLIGYNHRLSDKYTYYYQQKTGLQIQRVEE